MSLGAVELLHILLVASAFGLVVIWPAARVCSRIDPSPWLGVIAAMPMANVVLLWFVALTPWPTPPFARHGR